MPAAGGYPMHPNFPRALLVYIHIDCITPHIYINTTPKISPIHSIAVIIGTPAHCVYHPLLVIACGVKGILVYLFGCVLVTVSTDAAQIKVQGCGGLEYLVICWPDNLYNAGLIGQDLDQYFYTWFSVDGQVSGLVPGWCRRDRMNLIIFIRLVWWTMLQIILNQPLLAYLMYQLTPPSIFHTIAHNEHLHLLPEQQFNLFS